jgi:hypothetical protein
MATGPHEYTPGDQEYAWSFRAYQTTQDEDDAALILLHDANG